MAVADKLWYQQKKKDLKWAAKRRAKAKAAYWKNPKKARALRKAKYKKYRAKIIAGNKRWAKKHADKVREMKRRYVARRAKRNRAKGLTTDGKRRVSPTKRRALLKKAYAVHLKNLAKKKKADLARINKLLGSDYKYRAIKSLLYGSQKK